MAVVEERMWRQWSERAGRAFSPQQWWEQTRALEQHGRTRAMWVFRITEPEVWTVGFYSPDGAWHVDSDHGNKELAAARVHFLNGGEKQ